MLSFELSGRVAVITGAASGIGAATARRFAAAGANLVLADYSADGHDMAAVVADAVIAGVSVAVVETDVRKMSDVEALVETALSRFGRLDIALANAAIARTAPFESMDEDAFQLTLNVDLAGVYRLFRAAVPSMKKAGAGRLLATASTVGVMEAWNAHAHYAAAKAGITGMVRALAAELGPDGITVNAIAPGIIETPQTLDPVNSLGPDGVAKTAGQQPIRRVGSPDDIAAAYQYLASDAGSFVTGHTMVVDGGRTLVR